jgi:hypothetical protein
VQVDAASWLSVVVRSGPFRTAVNGTLVARPSRMTPSTRSRWWLHLDRRVSFLLGDHRLVGKSLKGSRQPGGGLQRLGLEPGARLHCRPRSDGGCGVICGSYMRMWPLVPAEDQRFPMPCGCSTDPGPRAGSTLGLSTMGCWNSAPGEGSVEPCQLSRWSLQARSGTVNSWMQNQQRRAARMRTLFPACGYSSLCRNLWDCPMGGSTASYWRDESSLHLQA